MLNEETILGVNTGQSARLDVLFQDEVRLDINVPLFYIKSGEEEIEQYVDEVAKPELDVCVENKKDVIAKAVNDGVDVINEAAENSERILNSYVEEVGKPEITSYAETTVKPELQSFADELKEAFDVKAAEKTEAVNILAVQTEASSQRPRRLRLQPKRRQRPRRKARRQPCRRRIRPKSGRSAV